MRKGLNISWQDLLCTKMQAGNWYLFVCFFLYFEIGSSHVAQAGFSLAM